MYQLAGVLVQLHDAKYLDTLYFHALATLLLTQAIDANKAL